MFPAFKEWDVIVEALLSGEQFIILRKGGIAEGRGGFSPDRAARFWLFPTSFHAQVQKTKPAAARLIVSSPSFDSASETTVTLRAFAEVAQHRFLADWEAVSRLDSFHLWTPDAIRERFDWGKPPGVHLFVVRVHRLLSPLILPRTADMGGCRSWIDLPAPFEASASDPVLDNEAFTARCAALNAMLPPA